MMLSPQYHVSPIHIVLSVKPSPEKGWRPKEWTSPVPQSSTPHV